MKPFVVAVAGGTCGGKSTLSDILEERASKKFKVTAIHMDNYYKKVTPTTIAPITRIEYVEHNHPSALEIEPMLKDIDEAVNGDSDLVIIEGVFALYMDEIRGNADFKIYVDLESDARIVRRITKHMSWGQTYEQVTDRYLDTVRFRHNELVEPTRWHADIVINGVLDKNLGADVAMTYIESKIKGGQAS